MIDWNSNSSSNPTASLRSNSASNSNSSPTPNSNHLILNPRLPEASRQRFEAAWARHVEGQLQEQIGLATSGSSGDAFGKLIVISKNAMLASARAVNERLASTAADVWFKPLPDFHVGGLGILARAHLSGAKVIEGSPDVKWNPIAFHSDLDRNQVTLTSLVPTQLFDLVQAGLHAPRSLRAVVIGGGRLESELHKRAVEMGWPALPSYGMTECSSQVATALSPHDPRLVPLPHVELRIGAGDRIEIRSSALLTGLIRFVATDEAMPDRDSKHEAEATNDVQSIFESPLIDGWFMTEDRGRAEPDGSLTILGRTQDFIKIGGEGVVFSRLEERLEKLKLSSAASGASGVTGVTEGSAIHRDIALLAAADARLGAKIILLSTADEPATQALVEAFNQGVAPFERIREAHRVSAIPRSALGKLLRREALALVGLEPPTNL